MTQISMEAIAVYLDSLGKRDMASEVRDLKTHVDRQAVALKVMGRAVMDLEKRLERYEPRPPQEPPVNNWTGD